MARAEKDIDEYPGAELFLPPALTLPALRNSVQRCRGCPLYKPAIQAVFGEGPLTARMMLVGEQPGDEEDKAGRPFVGPAGEVLDEALGAAGIDRLEVYITNAVKHFKFLIRGWRRWHKKPTRREADACHAWLQAELELCQPTVLVCLGATAAQALLGPTFRVTTGRGKDLASPHAPHTVATVHPSSILRQPTPDARHAAMTHFVTDLTLAASLLER